MTKEAAIKHKAVISWWLKNLDRGVWRKSEELWELECNPIFDEGHEYVINDEYAKYRKAEVDGFVIEYSIKMNGGDRSNYKECKIDDVFWAYDNLDDRRAEDDNIVFRIVKPVEYPIFMVNHEERKHRQYIVKFTSFTCGEVVEAHECSAYKVGDKGKQWIDHKDEIWKEVSDPSRLIDKDVIECWDEYSDCTRVVGFYDGVNDCLYSKDGRRDGPSYRNMRKLMPWEYPEWVEKGIDKIKKNKLER